MSTSAQIVATIGPASSREDILRTMIESGMDVARLNFAWHTREEGIAHIDTVRAIAAESGRSIPIIVDMPGPRVQLPEGHTYDASKADALSEHDLDTLALCAEKKVEYIAVSFVGSAEDIERYRRALASVDSTAKIIAKIERRVAVENLESILAVADAVMIARGDLGNEVPLEEIPFIQKDIIAKAKAIGKPVITATQMLFSMTEHSEPTRAEVTDVEEAILEGSDAVMLSEETSTGAYPALAVTMMRRIITETEQHRSGIALNSL